MLTAVRKWVRFDAATLSLEAPLSRVKALFASDPVGPEKKEKGYFESLEDLYGVYADTLLRQLR